MGDSCYNAFRKDEINGRPTESLMADPNNRPGHPERSTMGGWEHSARLIGQALDWTTPNWITMAHIGVTPLICLSFAMWRANEEAELWRLAGATLCTLALLSDKADGDLAYYQRDHRPSPAMSAEEENALPLLDRLRLRGPSHTGARLDPIADKLTFYGALLPLAVGYLPAWMIAANVALAVALVVIRLPRVADRLGLMDVRANLAGKIKMQVEIGALAALALFVPWPEFRYGASVFVLFAATVAAAFSLEGQFAKNWHYR